MLKKIGIMLKTTGIIIIKIIGIIWFLISVLIMIEFISTNANDVSSCIIASVIFLMIGAPGLLPMIIWRKSPIIKKKKQANQLQSELSNLYEQLNNFQEIMKDS